MELDFVLRPEADLPYAAHRQLRAAGPVVWSDSLNGWAVSSFEAVRTVLSDLSSFTSVGTAVTETFGAEAMLVDDTPLHHKVRAVWTKAVSRAALEARAAELRDIATATIKEIRPRLEAGEEVDLVPLFQRFITAYIAISFGVEFDKLEVFRRWSVMSTNAPVLGPDGVGGENEHRRVKDEVYALVHAEIDDRRQRLRRGDEPTDLIALMTAAEGLHGITRAKVVDNIFNFILGSIDTTERWLGNIVAGIYSRPGLSQLLREDRRLIEGAIEEVMRCEPVIQLLVRRAKTDSALEGQRIRDGDTIYLMIGAASRDPEAYEDPDSFDIGRRQKPLLGFGFGFHHCLGINVARQEAIAFTNAVLDQFPTLRIGQVDMGDTWVLWGPRKLMVRL